MAEAGYCCAPTQTQQQLITGWSSDDEDEARDAEFKPRCSLDILDILDILES